MLMRTQFLGGRQPSNEIWVLGVGVGSLPASVSLTY